jgi:tetratricopeptide (TPR) repeat protein
MGAYQEALDAFRSGDTEGARELSAEALAAARGDGDQPGEVDALCMLARVALREGDFARVGRLADEARACAHAAGDKRLERMPLHMQAVAARMAGELAAARGLYEESIELNRSLGEGQMVAAELHNLGYVELRDGRANRAIELFEQARLEARRTGYDGLNPYLVGDLAIIAAVKGELGRAARLAGAAAAAFTAAGQVPDPDDAAEQQRLRDRLTREIGADALGSLYAEGANLTPEDILNDLS